MIIKNKKAQEEIVGFIVLIVIVAIVFVIFLGISVKNKPLVQEQASKDIRQFLESTRQFTTSCALNEPYYVNLKELMGYCYNKIICLSGEEACVVLNKTIDSILKISFPAGENYPIKGYEFNVVYKEKIPEEKEEILLFLKQGNCSTSYSSADDFFPHGIGRISYSLKKCF